MRMIAFVVIIVVIVVCLKLKAKEVVTCRFCSARATWLRTPRMDIIEKYQAIDIDPSFNELQVMATCEECKVIAGGFDTTQWSEIK